MPKKSRKQRSKPRRHGSEPRAYDAFPLVHGLSPAQTVAAIRSGDGAVTRGSMYKQTKDQESEVVYRQQLNDLGLVDALLGFLQRCEEPFEAIELTAPDHTRRILSPYQWVNVLNCATTEGGSSGVMDEDKMDECRLLVARNISPLVHCMCSEDRRLFQSNIQWHLALDGFVRLVGNCAQTKKAIKILAGHGGLVDTLAQLVFAPSHRPDITKEAGECSTNKVTGWMKQDYEKDTFSRAASNAEKILSTFVNAHHQEPDGSGILRYDDADKSFLRALALCPIVGIESEEPFLLELLHLLNTRSTREDRRFPLHSIINIASAVGESVVSVEVVEGVVRYGAEVANCFEEAMGATMLILGMLQPSTGTFTRVSDQRMSVAIKAGVLEMCLKFADRYGNHPDPHSDKEQKMVTKLWHLANSCHVIALHRQSSRAISAKRNSIESALMDLGVDCQTAYGFANDQFDDRSTGANTFLIGWKHSCGEEGNDAIRSVVQAVQSTMHISATNCCHCLKRIEGAAVKRCSCCKRPAYCSRQCQTAHWKVGGHKLDCKRMREVNSLTVMGEGEKDIAKANDLECNVIVACNKLFRENIPRILQQAKFMNCEILDCVVSIELSHQIPFVKLFVADDDILNEYGIERDRFDRNRSNGALTCAYRSYVFNTGELEAEKSNGGRKWAVTNLSQTFPGSLAPHGSWKEAQAKVEGRVEDYSSLNEQRYFGGPSTRIEPGLDMAMEIVDRGLNEYQQQKECPDIDLAKAKADIRDRIAQGEEPREAIQKGLFAAIEEAMMTKMMANLFRDS